MRLKLGYHHPLGQTSYSALLTQRRVSHQATSQLTQLTLVCVRSSQQQVRGGRELEEAIPDGLKAFQADQVVGSRGREGC